MRITKANNQAIKYACLTFHYAKAVPVNPLGYNIYNDKDEWCGVILYSLGASSHLGEAFNLPMGAVMELTRCALNGKQECTSQAVAMTLKQLHKDCPHCRLVVSFADCDQSHLGTIYQATNWIYAGETSVGDTSAFIVNGKKRHRKSLDTIVAKKYHCQLTLENIRKYVDKNAQPFITKGKRKYLMPMDKKMRKQVEPLRQPYPKNGDWVKIDRNQFKHNEQESED